MEDRFEMIEFYYEEIIRETEKAYLFNLDDEREIWLPKSQVKELDENLKTFELPQWLAEENELI